MGSLFSKALDELMEKTDIASNDDADLPGTPQTMITEDPRSPATADVERTPLPNAVALKNQAPWDPRSPTPGIARTPLHAPIFETPPDTPEHVEQVIADPRSPTDQVERTPIVSCDVDVHRTWDLNHSELEEGDSLYPNPSSVPRLELEMSEEVSKSDYGSLENLLMYDTSISDNEDAPTDSAITSTSADDGDNVASEEPVTAEPTAEHEPTVSPIGSPVKMLAALSPSVTVSARQSPERSSAQVRSSTPKSKVVTSKSTRPGLSHRDTNSPLSIVQRKQAAKVSNRLTVQQQGAIGKPASTSLISKGSRDNSFATFQDKENRV